MLGAGLFTTSGIALSQIPSPTVILTAWLIAGLIALCGAISYGILAKEVTASGGEYIFLSRFIHPVAGYIAGIVSLFVGFSGASAYSALTLAAYVKGISSIPSVPVIASIAIGLCLIFRRIQLHTGSMIQNLFVVCQLGLLGLFILLSLRFIHLPAAPSFLPSSISPQSFATVVLWVFYSYTGFNAAIYVSGMAKHPEKNVPKAMRWGTLVILLLYLIVNAIFLYIPPQVFISGQVDIAARVAQYIGGDSLALIIRLVIIFTLFSAIYSMFIVGPSVYVAMSQDGVMPAGRGSNAQQLFFASSLQALIVLIIIWSTSLQSLLSYIGMTLSFSMLLTVGASLKILKRKQTKSLWQWFPPILFMIAASCMIGLASLHNPMELFYSVVTIGVGMILFLFKKKPVLEVAEIQANQR
jgi:APA family basic amino acid/polyamine antiporter